MLRHLLFGSKPRRDFFRFCPRPNAFSRSALQVIDSRPRVTLPSAASSATCGREQRYLRPRAARTAAASRQLLLIAQRAPTEWWRKSVEDAASARCQREAGRQAGMPHPSRGQTPLSSPLFPFSTTLPQPLFFCHHHLQPTKRKINLKKNGKLFPEINN